MFLRIVPLGNMSKEMLITVKNHLENLNIKCRVMPEIEIPKEAFNHWRKQYNAEVVLGSLYGSSQVKFIDASIPCLLLTDVDLYYRGLNFVFGLEYPGKSCAIVSTARLNPQFYDEKPDKDLLYDRVIKEVVHEMGHYFGLSHCMYMDCVMAFSPSVYDVDKKLKNFCDNCKVELMTKGINLG